MHFFDVLNTFECVCEFHIDFVEKKRVDNVMREFSRAVVIKKNYAVREKEKRTEEL